MDQASSLRQMVKSQNSERKVARVITVTSGKGGAGKTSVSVNLAITLSRMGKKVVILDGDFGLANVEVMLGIRPGSNLADLMFKGKKLSDIINEGPENIGFISGGSGIQELTNLSVEQITTLAKSLCELDNMADVIIIDTGAGISAGIMEFIQASAEVLVVVTPEPTSITDAYALLKTLNRRRGSSKGNVKIKLLANRVKNMEEGEELYTKLNMVVSRFLNFEMEYAGAIPADNNVIKAVMLQKPLVMAFPECSSSKAFRKVADKLCDNQGQIQGGGIARIFTDIIKKNLIKRKNELEKLSKEKQV